MGEQPAGQLHRYGTKYARCSLIPPSYNRVKFSQYVYCNYFLYANTFLSFTPNYRDFHYLSRTKLQCRGSGHQITEALFGNLVDRVA